MIITGRVTRIIRRRSAAGSPFRTLDLEKLDASHGHLIRLRYLAGLGVPDPERGQRVTVEGVPMIGGKTNIGGVRITIHQEVSLTASDMTEAEKAAWEVAVSRGMNISRADLRALLTAAITQHKRWKGAK